MLEVLIKGLMLEVEVKRVNVGFERVNAECRFSRSYYMYPEVWVR